jgi:hypothetical protein
VIADIADIAVIGEAKSSPLITLMKQMVLFVSSPLHFLSRLQNERLAVHSPIPQHRRCASELSPGHQAWVAEQISLSPSGATQNNCSFRSSRATVEHYAER